MSVYNLQGDRPQPCISAHTSKEVGVVTKRLIEPIDLSMVSNELATILHRHSNENNNIICNHRQQRVIHIQYSMYAANPRNQFLMAFRGNLAFYLSINIIVIVVVIVAMMVGWCACNIPLLHRLSGSQKKTTVALRPKVFFMALAISLNIHIWHIIFIY